MPFFAIERDLKLKASFSLKEKPKNGSGNKALEKIEFRHINFQKKTNEKQKQTPTKFQLIKVITLCGLIKAESHFNMRKTYQFQKLSSFSLISIYKSKRQDSLHI